jgi:hypothetical protein
VLHPRTPAVVRRPQLSVRRGTWVALLGPSLKDGIVGLGPDGFRCAKSLRSKLPGRSPTGTNLTDGASRSTGTLVRA